MKIDKDGNLIWQKFLGGSDDEIFSDAIETSDHNYILTCLTKSFDGQVAGNHSLSASHPDGWIVKINSGGNILWSKCMGGNLQDELSGILELQPGKFIISGTTRSGQTGNVSCNQYGSNDFWLFSVSDTTMLNYIEDEISTSIKVFPNPTSDFFTIDFSHTLRPFEVINIYNFYGLKILSAHISQKFFWKPPSPGVYFLKSNSKSIKLIAY